MTPAPPHNRTSNKVKNTPTFVKKLAKLEFPFQHTPAEYAPETTILTLACGTQVYPHLWCYLDREKKNRCAEFNPESLSAARIKATPVAVERLSKWFKFKNLRPATIKGAMRTMSGLMNWVDEKQNNGEFENILNDSNVALNALRLYHSHLRQRVQAHHITAKTAADRDQIAIAVMSQIHDRAFHNEIEPLKNPHTGGTSPPRDDEISAFMNTAQAIFDSVIKNLFPQSGNATHKSRERVLRLSATDDKKVLLSESYSDLRLMELGCIAFAALAIGDSGANLSQIQSYQEPEDLDSQLAVPDRVNLTQKQIKFRAKNGYVPVHLTTTTLSRIRAYLRLREVLRQYLVCPDVNAMFIQCKYSTRGKLARPHEITQLHDEFLAYLRKRFSMVGAVLPNISLRQLRLYKQQNIVRKNNLKVAADVMGHTVGTAIRAYSKAQESVRQSDIGTFLASLSDRVLSHSSELQNRISLTPIPTGSCEAHGRPEASDSHPLTQPDCVKTEGCFFCTKFHVHADETDAAKLMSCRQVLQRLAPMKGDSMSSERLYIALLDRIDALLMDIRRVAPDAHQRASTFVIAQGNLTAYWATKLQQLYLLGVLNQPTSTDGVAT